MGGLDGLSSSQENYPVPIPLFLLDYFVRKHFTGGFLFAVLDLSWILCSLLLPEYSEIKRRGKPLLGPRNPCISFISVSIWWKVTTTLFWYGSPFGLMASIALCFLGKLVKSGLLIFIQRNYWHIYSYRIQGKHPCSIRAWVPVSVLSLSFSLSGWFPGERRLAA